MGHCGLELVLVQTNYRARVVNGQSMAIFAFGVGKEILHATVFVIEEGVEIGIYIETRGDVGPANYLTGSVDVVRLADFPSERTKVLRRVGGCIVTEGMYRATVALYVMASGYLSRIIDVFSIRVVETGDLPHAAVGTIVDERMLIVILILTGAC